MQDELMSADFYNNMGFFRLFAIYEPYYWVFLLFGLAFLLMLTMPSVNRKTTFAPFVFVLFLLSLFFYDSASKSLTYLNSYNYCKTAELTKNSASIYVAKCLDAFKDYKTSSSQRKTPHYAMYAMATSRLQSEKLYAEPYDAAFIKEIQSLPTAELHNLKSDYEDSHSYVSSIETEMISNLKDINFIEVELDNLIEDSKNYNSFKIYALEHKFELKDFIESYNTEKKNLVKNRLLYDKAAAHCTRTGSFSACKLVESIYRDYKKKHEQLARSRNLKKILEVDLS